MTVILMIEAVVIAVLTVLVAGLLRSHADILRRLHDIDATAGEHHEDPSAVARTVASMRSGTAEAREVSGIKPDGGAVAVTVDGPSLTLLAFLSSGCTSCGPFWKRLAEGPDLPPGVRVVIVTRGGEHESPAAVAALAPPSLLTVMSSRAYEDYAVEVSPYFVLVDGGRVMGEGASRRWSQMRNLITRALADASRADRQAGRSGPQRLRDSDQELLAAGLTPDHASLYHHPEQP